MHIPVSMHALHIIALVRTRMFFFGTDGRMDGRTRTDAADGRTDGQTNGGWSRWMVGWADGWMDGRTDGAEDGRSGGTDGWSDERTDGRKNGLVEGAVCARNAEMGMIEQKCVSFYSAGIDQAKRCEFLQCQHSAGTVPAQCRQQCRQQCRHGKYSTF